MKIESSLVPSIITPQNRQSSVASLPRAPQFFAPREMVECEASDLPLYWVYDRRALLQPLTLQTSGTTIERVG